MNKLLLAFLILSASALGFVVLRQATERTRASSLSEYREWQAATNQLAGLSEAAASLRDEMSAKRNRLKQASLHPNLSPELLKLLDGDVPKAGSAAAAQLRELLGIGWNSSADYVLVSRRVLQPLDFQRISPGGEAVDEACAVLAISPEEQSGIKKASQRVRELALSRIQRTEPVGDIVAQYTFPPPDPSLLQAMSNQFAAEITAVLGQQRTDVFLGSGFHSGWRELSREMKLTEREPVTMTIRRSMASGNPSLSCECRQGNTSDTMEVRYAHYPSCFSFGLFPGGWDDIARREGFDAPKFQPQAEQR